MLKKEELGLFLNKIILIDMGSEVASGQLIELRENSLVLQNLQGRKTIVTYSAIKKIKERV